MKKSILKWLSSIKGLVFISVLLSALAVFISTSLVTAYLYEHLMAQHNVLLTEQLNQLPEAAQIKLTLPEVSFNVRLTYIAMFLAFSAVILVLTIFIANRLLKPMYKSLLSFNQQLSTIKKASDFSKLQPKKINFVFSELQDAFNQVHGLARHLGRLLNDKNLLELKNNLLSKLVIKDSNLSNWNKYVKATFNDIHLALPFNFIGMYVHENKQHKIRIYWAGAANAQQQQELEQLLKYKLNSLEGADAFDWGEIKIRHYALNGVLSKNYKPRLELYVQHLEKTPQVGCVQGVFLHSNAMQDLALRLNINSILIVLLNLLGSSKAISGYTKQLEKSIHLSEQESAMAADVLYGHLLVKNTDTLSAIEHQICSSSRFSGDVIQVKTSPSGRILILLADATGHGLSATITIMPVISVFNAMAQKDHCLEDILQEMNKNLARDLPDDRFVAAQLIEINPKTKTLKLWNGGMPAAFLLAEGQLLQKFKSQHMALGILDENLFDATPIQINYTPAQELFIYSDGLIEQENPNLEAFGVPRLLAELNLQPSLNALIASTLNYAELNQPDDDISVCRVKLKDLN